MAIGYRQAALPMVTQTFAIASTWRRFFAFLLDWIVIGVVSIVAGVLLGIAEQTTTIMTDRAGVETTATMWRLSYGWASVLPGVVSGLYLVGSWLLWGRTISQRAFGLYVSPAGRPAKPTPVQSLARWALLSGWMIAVGATELVSPISGIDGFLNVGAFAWVVVLVASTAIDERHQGFHDQAADTLVVRLRPVVVMPAYTAPSGGRPPA